MAPASSSLSTAAAGGATVVLRARPSRPASLVASLCQRHSLAFAAATVAVVLDTALASRAVAEVHHEEQGVPTGAGRVSPPPGDVLGPPGSPTRVAPGRPLATRSGDNATAEPKLQQCSRCNAGCSRGWQGWQGDTAAKKRKMFMEFAYFSTPDEVSDVRDCRRCSGNICYNNGDTPDAVERLVLGMSARAHRNEIVYAWTADKSGYTPKLLYIIGGGQEDAVTTVDVTPTSLAMQRINGGCYYSIADYFFTEILRKAEGQPVPSLRCASTLYEMGSGELKQRLEVTALRIRSENNTVLASLLRLTLLAREAAKSEAGGEVKDYIQDRLSTLTEHPAEFMDQAVSNKPIMVDVKNILGIGRSGVVFGVEAHPKTEPSKTRTYAMKLIYGSDTDAQVREEVRILAALKGCEGTCVKLRYGKWEGIPTMIVDQVSGTSLMDKLRKEFSSVLPLSYLKWLKSMVKFQLALKKEGVWCPDQHADNFLVTEGDRLKCIDLGRTEPAPEDDLMAPREHEGEPNVQALKWLDSLLSPLRYRENSNTLGEGEGWCAVLRLLRSLKPEEVTGLQPFKGLRTECAGDASLSPWSKADLEEFHTRADRAVVDFVRRPTQESLPSSRGQLTPRWPGGRRAEGHCRPLTPWREAAEQNGNASDVSQDDDEDVSDAQLRDNAAAFVRMATESGCAPKCPSPRCHDGCACLEGKMTEQQDVESAVETLYSKRSSLYPKQSKTGLIQNEVLYIWWLDNTHRLLITFTVLGQAKTMQVQPASTPGTIFVDGNCVRKVEQYLRQQATLAGGSQRPDTKCALSQNLEPPDVPRVTSGRVVGAKEDITTLVALAAAARGASPIGGAELQKELVAKSEHVFETTQKRTFAFTDDITGHLVSGEVVDVFGMGSSGISFRANVGATSMLLRLILGGDPAGQVANAQRFNGCEGTCARLVYAKATDVPAMLLEVRPGPSLREALSSLQDTTAKQYLLWLADMVKFQLFLRAQGTWGQDQYGEDFIASQEGLQSIDFGRTEAGKGANKGQHVPTWLQMFLSPLQSQLQEIASDSNGWCEAILLLQRFQGVRISTKNPHFDCGNGGTQVLDPWSLDDLGPVVRSIT